MATIKKESEKRTYNVNGVEYTLQLTDIDFYPRMSDETLAFCATLVMVVNGAEYHIECENDGRGGCTDIHDYTKHGCKHHTATLDTWLKTQRDEQAIKQMKELFKVDMECFKSLEGEVNNMLAKWCDENNL